MDESPFPAPSLDNKPASKKRRRFLFLILAIIFIVVLILLGSKFLGTKSANKEGSVTPTPTEFIIPSDTPTPEVSQSPTPTPKPTKAPTPTAKSSSSGDSVDSATGLDRKDLSVAVQNGSGEVGVAGKAADILKNLGYSIASTGNADNYNYSGVTIQVKNAQKAYLPILKKDLGSDYTISSATSDLTASSSADALVIVGK